MRPNHHRRGGGIWSPSRGQRHRRTRSRLVPAGIAFIVWAESALQGYLEAFQGGAVAGYWHNDPAYNPIPPTPFYEAGEINFDLDVADFEAVRTPGMTISVLVPLPNYFGGPVTCVVPEKYESSYPQWMQITEVERNPDYSEAEMQAHVRAALAFTDGPTIEKVVFMVMHITDGLTMEFSDVNPPWEEMQEWFMVNWSDTEYNGTRDRIIINTGSPGLRYIRRAIDWLDDYGRKYI